MAYTLIPIGGGHYLIINSFAVTSVTPATGKNSVITKVDIVGTEFVAGCTVTIGSTSLTNVDVKSSIFITGNIPARIDAGTYDITVTKPDGSTATLTNGFIVTEILDVSSINPVAAYNNINNSATIYGSKFVDGCTVTIGSTSLTGVTFVSSFELTATIPSGLSEGDHDVVVTNPDTNYATLTNGYLSKVRVDSTTDGNKGCRLKDRILYNMITMVI